VIVCIDIVAILAAVGLYGRADATSWLFGISIFCLLVCSGSQRAFINPRLERDIPLTVSGLFMPILGDARAFLPTVQHYNVTKVIVAYGAMDEADMVEILRACDGLEIEIYIVPRFFELGVTTGGKRYDEIWGIPLTRLHRSAVRAAARRSKRMFDIVVAMVALLLASPISLATALAVHLSTPGPIFLRQRRVGKEGREFELLKFRSMVVNKHSDTSWG
jgi:Bacterial sugar transferase